MLQECDRAVDAVNMYMRALCKLHVTFSQVLVIATSLWLLSLMRQTVAALMWHMTK